MMLYDYQNPETKSIIPTEYLGVKLISFGFAGQGRAIMRGPMVSGVINQLLTTTDWYFSVLTPMTNAYVYTIIAPFVL